MCLGAGGTHLDLLQLTKRRRAGFSGRITTAGVWRSGRHGGANAMAKELVSSAPRATAAGGSRKRAAAALRAAASGICTALAQRKITLGDSFVSKTCAEAKRK